jgi:MFS family permease
MVPFQFFAYLSNDLRLVIPSFCIMIVLASMFFGPSFAVSQTLATLRSRAAATSLLLLVQTLVGLGLGPMLAGYLSDVISHHIGSEESLRYALCAVGLINLWAALHYFLGSRTIRQNIENTERLNRAALAA